MATRDHARELADVAAALAAEHGKELTTAMICKLAVEVIGPCDHASITIRSKRGRFRTTAASSQIAEDLDAHQYELTDGPCLSSVEGGEVVFSADLDAESRWPGWTTRATGARVGTVMSIPLRGDGGLIGSMNLYGHRPGSWDVDSREVALLYATHAAIAMDAAQVASGLHTANASRHQIGLAQGILMQRYGLSVAQAFAVLQRYSSSTNTKLTTVAAEVVRDLDGEYSDGVA